MKQIDKNKFIEMAKDNTRNVVAKHFGIADMTAQRLADELGIKFKKFKPSGKNKPKYKLV
jgi:Holliday junction resolvasome RuvABC DNA-binding subunit